MPQFSTNTQNALEYLYVCVSKSFLGGYLFDFFSNALCFPTSTLPHYLAPFVVETFFLAIQS
jgi:hypothetical protein